MADGGDGSPNVECQLGYAHLSQMLTFGDVRFRCYRLMAV